MRCGCSRFARDLGVQRVVMTSSTAAVAYGRGGRETSFTEADWSDETGRTDTSAYERSKIIAERAAWDWVSREGRALELVTICPGAVLGPVLGRDFSASIDIVKKLMDGSLPGLPRFGWPLADVRDIADLHVRAMLAPEAKGQRYIGAGPFYWMSDIANVLRARMARSREARAEAQPAQLAGPYRSNGGPGHTRPVVRTRQAPSSILREGRNVNSAGGRVQMTTPSSRLPKVCLLKELSARDDVPGASRR